MRTRSPFPGMDPWLESFWGDMHHRIIQYACDQIESQLPPGLIAAVETMVYLIDSDWEVHRLTRPDFAVVDYGTVGVGDTSVADDGGTAVAEPIRISIPDEPYTEGHIEIREVGTGNSLITAIEVLSPTNKLDPHARAAYVQKRREYHTAHVNVVELDLLRKGKHLIDVPLENIAAEFITPYMCAVRRGGEIGRLGTDYYRLPMRNRLPRIKLPLRLSDADIVLDLQSPVDEAYRRGRYGIRIDYTKPPDPPLSPDDTAWAAELIAVGG